MSSSSRPKQADAAPGTDRDALAGNDLAGGEAPGAREAGAVLGFDPHSREVEFHEHDL